MVQAVTRPYSQLIKMQRAFSPEELDAIIQAFEENPKYSYYTDFIRCHTWTGARSKELTAMMWNQMEENSFLLGDRYFRRFPLNPQLRELFARIRPENPAPDALVFPVPGTESLELNLNNFRERIWKPALKSIGLEGRQLAGLRYTFFQAQLEAGTDLRQLSRIADISIDKLNEYRASFSTAGKGA